MRSFLLLIFIILGSGLGIQGAELDSLQEVLARETVDSSRVKLLNEMAYHQFRTHPEEAIQYGEQALLLARDKGYRRGMAAAYKNIGLGHYVLANYVDAFKNWESSLEIYEDLDDHQMVSNLESNLGAVYYTRGMSEKALEYYIPALRIAEKLDDKHRIATLMTNIGSVYSEQDGALDEARSYYMDALKYGEEYEFEDVINSANLNLGQLYFRNQSYDTALVFFEKTLKTISGEIERASALGFIGRIYTEQGNYSGAVQRLSAALEMASSAGAQRETVQAHLGLADAFFRMAKYRQSLHHFQQARDLAHEVGLNQELSEAFGGLSSCYSALGDYERAFEFLSSQNEIENTIYRIESERRTNNLMFSYQLEKKDVEIEMLEREAEIEQLKNRRQRAMTLAMGALGFMLLLLAIGVYSRMRFIRKTKDQISAQKDEIESQKNEITDSITYAERIQRALLPSGEKRKELMPEHFMLFKPKDIVSGDFYWIREVQGHLVMVTADCTGHGVPGAFMSMLGISVLNDLIGDRCYNAPGAILDQMRNKIKELLAQEGKMDEQKDGMDMSLAILNKNNRELHYAGAYNPLYIVRKNGHAHGELEKYQSMENGSYTLFEIKGDKQPIAAFWEEIPFSTSSLYLREDDTFYMFSDGYVDQFGGEKRKKFKAVNLKRLLLSIQDKSMEEQERILDERFEDWRGQFEQIDDISVMGIRL